MSQHISIGGRIVGHDQPCYIVAEMSGNHGQDYNRALAIVKAAAEAGADAVKMQAYTADTITLQHDGPDFQIQKGNSWAAYNTLHELYQAAYTPWEWFEPLTKEARALGMEAFCSVFDHSSVDFMESIGTSAYKIAAPEITDIPLLRKVAMTGKPVILSSGLSTREDLELAAETLRSAGCEQFIILKCTSEYPAPIEQANLRTIQHISDTFNCLSGLSDHTLDIAVPVAAVCVGACAIEKHFTLDTTKTVDSFFSLQPAEFSQMVSQIRLAEKALGSIDYTMAGKESGNANGRRSLYASKPIRAGELFSEDNIRSVRPAYGLHPKHWDQLIGTEAVRDIDFGERLILNDLPSSEVPLATEDPISSIEKSILELFLQSGAVAAADNQYDYQLLDDESLDSFTKISIIIELEAEFQTRLAPAELMKEGYRSIAGLARLIAARATDNNLKLAS